MKKILLFGIVFLTLITLASAAIETPKDRWSMDEANYSAAKTEYLNDFTGQDLDNDGGDMVGGLGSLNGNATRFVSANTDWLNGSKPTYVDATDSFTVSMVVNVTTVGAGQGTWMAAATAVGNRWTFGRATNIVVFALDDGSTEYKSCQGVTVGEHHFWFNASSGNPDVYMNNTQCTTSDANNLGVAGFFIGSDAASNRPSDAIIDEVCIWDSVLNDANRTAMYNNGDFANCTAGVSAPASSDNNASFSTISFTPSNPNSTSLIESASNLTTENPGGSNVTISWYINKSLKVHQEFNDTANETEMEMNFSCSTYGCTDGDLINVTYEGTVGNDKVNSSSQVEINDTGNLVLRAYEKISGNKLTSFNISTPQITGTTKGEINLTGIEIGTTSVTMTAINYINSITNTSIPITFGGSTEVNITGFYDANITFNVTHTGGAELTGYTAQVFSFNHSSFEENDSGNPANMGLINGAYSVTINLPGYALQTENFSVNGNDTINITLYLTNSFYLQILDEQTRLPINDRNVTIQFISSLEASNYSTENGTLFQDAFIPAEIEIRYNTRDYRERSYYHYLSNQSFNNITLYLLNSSEGSLVIIDNVDESGAEIQGVTLQLLRGYLIGGNEEYEVVEMDLTDFAGEAIISAELNEPLYRIRVYRNVTDKEQLFFSNPFEISSTTLRVTLALLGNPVASFNTEQDVSFNPLTYNNETALWRFTYDASLASGVFSEMCLRVDRVADLGIRFHNETCSSSQVATLNVYYNNSRFGSQAKAYMKTNTEYSDKLLAVGSFSWNTIQSTVGNVGLLMGSLIVYTVAMIMSFNPVTLVIGALAGFLAVVQIGIIGSSLHVIISLIILGGIIIFKMRT